MHWWVPQARKTRATPLGTAERQRRKSLGSWPQCSHHGVQVGTFWGDRNVLKLRDLDAVMDAVMEAHGYQSKDPLSRPPKGLVRPRAILDRSSSKGRACRPFLSPAAVTGRGSEIPLPLRMGAHREDSSTVPLGWSSPLTCVWEGL